MVEQTNRVLFGFVWVVVVALIALGVAGLTAAVDHTPGTAARAELTWAADRAAIPALDKATADLEALAADVDALGLEGRGALAALAAQEFDLLDSAISNGALKVIEVRDDTLAIRQFLTTLEGFGPGAQLRFSKGIRDRHATLVGALDATDGLSAQWARLKDGGLSAARAAALIDRHDKAIIDAIDVGVGGSFQTAIARIDRAGLLLDELDAVRAQLANTTDVSQLIIWLQRNRSYDAAIKALYVASREAGDRVTPALRSAVAAEQAARRELPDGRALVIIMAEIGRGGLNQAVIAVEEAKGELASALEILKAQGPGGTVPAVTPPP